jgi:hypothetical protein
MRSRRNKVPGQKYCVQQPNFVFGVDSRREKREREGWMKTSDFSV